MGLGKMFRGIAGIAAAFNPISLGTNLVAALFSTGTGGGSFEQNFKKNAEHIFNVFGVKAENTLSTSVSDRRIMGDDYKNLLSKVALIHQSSQRDIIDIIQATHRNASINITKYFDYGKTNYINGLPSSSIHVITFPEASVVGVINTHYAVNCELITTDVKLPTIAEYTSYMLKESHGYDLLTNTLSYNGLPFTLGTVTVNTVAKTYSAAITDGTTNAAIVFPAPEAMTYYVARWKVVGGSNEHYWVYRIGAGTYPNLDTTESWTELEMTPIVEIRNNLINTNADVTSKKYLQTKEILSTVNLDLDQITTSLMENPDISNVTDAFVYFGLDMADTSPVVAKYMFHMFSEVFDNAVPTNSPKVGSGFVALITELTNAYRITIQEGNYNTSIGWSQQTKSEIHGVIGDIGTYSSTVTGSVNLTLKYQNTATTYIEYVLYELFSLTSITRGNLSGVVSKTLITGPVIVPMSYALLDVFSPVEQVELFAKGLRLATYSSTVIHLEFYQTETFMAGVQLSMIIISIAVAVASGGTLSQIVYSAGQNMLMSYAIGYVIKEILASTNSPLLKFVYTMAILAAASQTGYFDTKGLMFLEADMVTTSVTQFTEFKMNELQGDIESFNMAVKSVYEELSTKMESISEQLSADFIVKLNDMDTPLHFLKGPAFDMYSAIQMNYDFVDICIRKPYDQVFEYDKYFILRS